MENPTPLRIFLVDDDPFCLALYNQILKNLGQQDIHLYPSSKDCLDNLGLGPDLVLLDYQIQPFDGAETLKKIKNTAPNVQVVLITGHTDTRVAVDVLQSGALDYLPKSRISEQRLFNLLGKAMTIRSVRAASKKRRPVQTTPPDGL